MAILQSTVISGSLTMSGSAFAPSSFATGSAPVTGSTGQIFFDSTNTTLRISGVGSGGGVWSSGGAIITARFRGAGAGIQTSALYFGGATGPQVTCTEEYNGST